MHIVGEVSIIILEDLKSAADCENEDLLVVVIESN